MEENFAKQVIVEAVDRALLKGCFNLVEACNITKALEKLEIFTTGN